MSAPRKPSGRQPVPTESQLDDALKMTFPASDPVSLAVAKPDAARLDRKPPRFSRHLIDELARRAKQKQ